ncbi:IS3 family transposase [Salegentibacter sp. F188]|uniref:IS3 family transposase n=1 Tax=Autumnicola patrickiae TaxID=3075591 RepID=A0ABU3DWP5_9FLAO|nr:IS3 family transposase [Salegentibacter sp. F188]MDT0688160.1 IS3 family transposase [Salegentibacter sp. F188]
MNQLYESIGISKQAVHQYARRQAAFDNRLMQLMEEADDLRRVHPGCGVEKMYSILKPDFIGRDRFVIIFMQLGYRLKRKKNYRRTPIAGKIYYPNVIKGMKINAPSVVWQSDITYYRVGDKFYYVVFIIDVYTKRIVGYQVSDNMRGTANVKALKMALKENKAPKIHHSDRGSQYTYKSYIDLLKANTTTISMALSAQDNAYAERINRTIKEEYLDHWRPQTFYQLKSQVNKAVNNYNNKRSHNHLQKRNPDEFEKYWSTLNPKERTVITIFDSEN